MYLRLERMRLQEALCARDAVVARFSEACASIRQKTCAIERLQHDKDDLEKQVGLLKGRQAALVPVTGKNAPDKNRLAIEVGRLAEMFRTLQDQVDSLEQKGNGKEKHTGAVDGGENVHRVCGLTNAYMRRRRYSLSLRKPDMIGKCRFTDYYSLSTIPAHMESFGTHRMTPRDCCPQIQPPRGCLPRQERRTRIS